MFAERQRVLVPIVIGALALAGVAIRANQYATPRSLWLDEAFLALNIVSRSPLELLFPLDYNQGAPVGVLLVMWSAVALLGATEAALRLLPFLAGVATALCFAVLAWRMLGGASLIAVALVAVAPPLIAYSVEAKQYAVDALATVVVALAARWALDAMTPRRLATLGGVSAVVVWCSHPAVFVIGAAGVAVLGTALWARQWRALALATASMLAIAASFGATYALSLESLQRNPALRAFWREAFWPWPPQSLADLIWPLESIVLGLMRTLDVGWPLGAAVVTAIGLVALARRAWADAVLCGLPIVAALVASAWQAYPFGGRLVLFLAPLFALLLTAGVRWIWDRRGIGRPLAIALTAVFVGWPAVVSLTTEPVVIRQEVRPLVHYLRAAAEPTDTLYVFRAATPAFQFYQRRFPVRLATQFGASPTDPLDWRPYLDDVRSLRGRVWVLFSHTKYGEDAFYLEELDRLGERLERVEQPGASLYLYWLPEPPSTADAPLGPEAAAEPTGDGATTGALPLSPTGE
ncbi:MAG: hypothetical protein NZ518_02555 [Dehalococcoidia bacterium]|nr:hypothetical protein [Dehalococcoidia bacterium]